jgi:hypothetical protein
VFGDKEIREIREIKEFKEFKEFKERKKITNFPKLPKFLKFSVLRSPPSILVQILRYAKKLLPLTDL